MDAVRQIADAVLYEGYILWPYRRSATKNQQRWTFGGVYPRAHSEGRVDDPWMMRTQCLLEAPAGATVEVAVRFLHVVRRQVARVTADGLEPVEELTVGGERHLSWDEAVEREPALVPLELDDDATSERWPIAIEAGSEREDLLDPSGRRAGAVVRSWEGLEGEIELVAEPARSRASTTGSTVTILNEHRLRRRWAARRGAAAYLLLDPHGAARVRRRVRLAHRSAGAPGRGGGVVPQRGRLAGARRRARRSPHPALVADHPRGLPAGRPREPGGPLRRRRDRRAPRAQRAQPHRRGEGRDAGLRPARAGDPRAHRGSHRGAAHARCTGRSASSGWRGDASPSEHRGRSSSGPGPR